jgi:hypothetical protein
VSTNSSIPSLLDRISELLNQNGESDWGSSFQRLKAEYGSNPHGACGKILSVYGGMGSFNDIILHSPNGIPLSAENDELDRLRSELYSECR